jgi:succinate dehydrogenase/fumarate reductase flavoprotein subunit
MSEPSENVDVVVVGAGLAGVAAALTAAEAGATVCLLEKGADFGGSSVRAGGGLLFAGTDLQASFGVEDGLPRQRDHRQCPARRRADDGRLRPEQGTA